MWVRERERGGISGRLVGRVMGADRIHCLLVDVVSAVGLNALLGGYRLLLYRWRGTSSNVCVPQCENIAQHLYFSV